MNAKPDPEDEKRAPEDEELSPDPVDKAMAAMWERDMAMDLAAEESVKRQMAESEALEARLAARQKQADAQEMSAQRSLLRHELDNERAAAANSTFGFYLMTGVLIALLIIGGIYFYFRATNNRVEANTPKTSVTVGEPPAAPAPAPVIVPAPPPVINVTPPPTPSERNATGGTDTNKNQNNQSNPDAGSKDNGTSPP